MVIHCGNEQGSARVLLRDEQGENEPQGPSVDDQKLRRRRVKRQQHKQKKREAKQQQQQQQQLAPKTPPRDAALTESTDAACKGAPTSPFTFSSFLKPATCSFATLKDTSPTSSRASPSVFETHDEQTIMGSSVPTLGAFDAESAYQKSSLVVNTRLPLTYRQEESEEGEEPFETQLSPLVSCCESLLFSVDSTQTICMERLPIAGRSGALSAPSSPLHSQYDFWDSDETVTDGASLLLEGYHAPVKIKNDTHKIRRASSVDFGDLSRTEEWALESLIMQHKLQKEEEPPQDVVTVDHLNIRRFKTACRDAHSVCLGSTDDKASDIHHNYAAGGPSQCSTVVIPLVDSDEENRYREQTAQDLESDPQELTTDGVDREQRGTLYTPHGFVRAHLQDLYLSGSPFFYFFEVCGEVQNEEGQYRIIDVEQLRSKPIDPESEVGVWENTMLQIYPGQPPVGLTISSESVEEREQKMEEGQWNQQQNHDSPLSSALQKCKERLRRQAEEDGKQTKTPIQDKSSGKKVRLAGGGSTKWASVRRRQNAKAGESPKKGRAKELSTVT